MSAKLTILPVSPKTDETEFHFRHFCIEDIVVSGARHQFEYKNNIHHCSGNPISRGVQEEIARQILVDELGSDYFIHKREQEGGDGSKDSVSVEKVQFYPPRYSMIYKGIVILSGSNSDVGR